MQIQNFSDVYREIQRKKNAAADTKKLIKNTANELKKITEAKAKQDINITSFVANDLLTCARRRNNVLTEANYAAEGRYTLIDVKNCFGSLIQACTQLKIINPENVEDKEMILQNIKDVFEFTRKIDEVTYREYGTYSYAAIDKRWNFNKLLIEAGLAELTILYPIYPIKQMPRHARLTWSYTHDKKIYGV